MVHILKRFCLEFGVIFKCSLNFKYNSPKLEKIIKGKVKNDKNFRNKYEFKDILISIFRLIRK